MQYAVLILLWACWCGLHSTLIAAGVTRRLERLGGALFRYYRLTYNLVALLTLLPVLVYSLRLDGPPVFAWSGGLRIVQALLAAGALACFAGGARRYDLQQFLGVRQLRGENACPALTADCALDTGGILQAVRHPWYTGGILIVWARDLNLAGLVGSLAISLYLVIGAFLEERKLERQFGEAYRTYQRQVSMLVPVKWIVARLGWGAANGRR